MGQILTSISGLPISAASAGFAPTNSAEVSAIAYGYQVVSSTATELYAGTAYLTSVNDAPVSASRAGNAANASMANSAYYDGTGRLISSLPDSATVSSIASGYAESAASSKLDATAQVVTATAGDGTYVTSINGLGISGQGGGGGVTVQTASARTMYSAADNSAVTGFSGIDGVGPVVLRSGTVVAGDMKMQLGGIGSLVPYRSSQDGDQNYMWSTGNILLLSGSQGYGYYKGHQLWLCRGSGSTSHRISFDVNNTTADVMVYQSGHSAVITPTGFSIWGPTTAVANRRIIDSAVYDRWNGYSAKQDPLAFAYNTSDQISSINGSALAGGGGGIDSTTCSAIASSYAESAASSKLDTTAFNSADFYTTANESGYVDSAAVSSIASGYAESAASSKLDSSASSSFYTTANESGFLTGLPIDISVRDLSASRHVRATATGQDLYGNFDYAGMYFRSGSQRPYNIGIDNTGANFYIATAKYGFERIYASSIQNWNSAYSLVSGVTALLDAI